MVSKVDLFQLIHVHVLNPIAARKCWNTIIDDRRIEELENINNWFKLWPNTVKTQYHSASESNKHQISWQNSKRLNNNYNFIY